MRSSGDFNYGYFRPMRLEITEAFRISNEAKITCHPDERGGLNKPWEAARYQTNEKTEAYSDHKSEVLTTR